jgi:hypothetical protein
MIKIEFIAATSDEELEMENRMNRISLLLAATLALCLLIAMPGAAFAQRPARVMANPGQMMQNRDPLQSLKNALQAAGAAVLSPDQETYINGLISDFRAAHKPASPSADIQAARIALDDAILAQNSGVAGTAIKTITDNQTTQTYLNMLNAAAFAISVVKELTPDQIKLLQNRTGTGGLVGLIESLVGGPGGLLQRGPGGPGQGRGAQGQGVGVQGQGRVAVKK